MAITDNSIVVEKLPLNGNVWAISAYSADLSGTESLKAAVTNKSHYITKIVINCSSAITVSIGGGETTGALTATYLGPIIFSAFASTFTFDFGDDKGMKLLPSTALTIDASGAGAVSIYIEGKTG